MTINRLKSSKEGCEVTTGDSLALNREYN
jgi:hypothetical protein